MTSIDFELGIRITGSGFPVQQTHGCTPATRADQLFPDFNTANGYTEVLPPYMVNEASALRHRPAAG